MCYTTGDHRRFGHTTNFAFERAIGNLGDVVTNGRDVETTVAKHWLLRQAVQSLDVQFENVLTRTGQLEDMSLRDAIAKKLLPANSVELLNTLVNKELRNELIPDYQNETNVANFHIDKFHQTSMLHPLRLIHNPVELLGVCEVKITSCIGQITMEATPTLGFYSGGLLKYAQSATTVTPAILHALNDMAWREMNNRSVYKHHSSVSLHTLPYLSTPLGAAPTELRLVYDEGKHKRTYGTRQKFDERVLFTSSSGVGERTVQDIISPKNAWTVERVRLAIQTRLLTHRSTFDMWEMLDDRNEIIIGVAHVTSCSAYQVGREMFASTQRVHASRSHALIIDPISDDVLYCSRFALGQNSPVFKPDSVPCFNTDAGIKRERRSWLHPVEIISFLLITVEVAHRDHIADPLNILRQHASKTGYRMLVLPFALCRLHLPHALFRNHAFGDLAEIWSGEFAPIDLEYPLDLARHLIPLNRQITYIVANNIYLQCVYVCTCVYIFDL